MPGGKIWKHAIEQDIHIRPGHQDVARIDAENIALVEVHERPVSDPLHRLRDQPDVKSIQPGARRRVNRGDRCIQFAVGHSPGEKSC
jgi:hypothetical protein